MKLFGTDGIRGKANHPPMTGEFAFEIGRAAAYVLKKKHGRDLILIGKDTRLSGYMIESALTSGICSMGVDVILIGPMPTPGIAFVTRSLRVDAGIVISASHNPYDDNGIKLFGSEGFKLPDSVEREIEEEVFSEKLKHIRPLGNGIGKAHRVEDAAGRYIEYVKASFTKGMTLEGVKIVVDCANGSTYKITPSVLRELGANVISINDKPDGVNINAGCGAMHPEVVQKEVLRHKADIGIAHDGDGDRTILCDEKGEIIDGDKIMAICALNMKKENRLNGNTVVATVMSNIGFEIFMKKSGINIVRTQVGDRYVVEEMMRKGSNLGGEQSGEKFPKVMDAIAKAEKALASGRILVRPSGTEPKIRVMVEGSSMKQIKGIAEDIAKVIKTNMS
ncbi:MAG: phosphoglucosamine mutase [Nitrospirae bacterium]|nr:phosphoglucosamine mutase [Nitrospirota bacterium]